MLTLWFFAGPFHVISTWNNKQQKLKHVLLHVPFSYMCPWDFFYFFFFLDWGFFAMLEDVAEWLNYSKLIIIVWSHLMVSRIVQFIIQSGNTKKLYSFFLSCTWKTQNEKSFNNNAGCKVQGFSSLRPFHEVCVPRPCISVLNLVQQTMIKYLWSQRESNQQ